MRVDAAKEAPTQANRPRPKMRESSSRPEAEWEKILQRRLERQGEDLPSAGVESHVPASRRGNTVALPVPPTAGSKSTLRRPQELFTKNPPGTSEAGPSPTAPQLLVEELSRLARRQTAPLQEVKKKTHPVAVAIISFVAAIAIAGVATALYWIATSHSEGTLKVAGEIRLDADASPPAPKPAPPKTPMKTTAARTVVPKPAEKSIQSESAAGVPTFKLSSSRRESHIEIGGPWLELAGTSSP